MSRTQPVIAAPVLYDNAAPRYLPHLQHPRALSMSLAPLVRARWIETDNHLGRYHRHKLEQRDLLGDRVYRATPGSLQARRELAALLLTHLTTDQAGLYRRDGERLNCIAGNYCSPLQASEPLWNCSLWVADDLLVMEKKSGEYHLTAASLCSAGHWRLEEKFERPLREIHDPVPGIHQALSPSIDRFFEHLKPERPVTRSNWSLQAGDHLNARTGEASPVTADTAVFYRSERQTLVRLPDSGAVAFTIRTYLHPLSMLEATPGALPALFAAIDQAPPAIAHYKGLDRLGPALAKFRERPACRAHDTAGVR